MDVDGYRKITDNNTIPIECDVCLFPWEKMNPRFSFAEVNTSQSSGGQKERDERKGEWVIV